MKRIASAFTVVLAALLSATLQAAPILLSTTMTGPQENPPNASPGTGLAVVIIDAVAHTLSVHVEFQDLTGGNVAAHIHCCVNAPGNVGVATATPTFPGFPTGATAGTYDAVFDTLDAATYRAGFITLAGGTPALAEAMLFTGLLAGRAYFNIHTPQFPGGEIRGFLQVPEPASLALVGMALVVAGVMRHRRF